MADETGDRPIPAGIDPADRDGIDPTELVDLLLRDLRTTRSGLAAREAARRLVAFGPNRLRRTAQRRRARELAEQFTHPLALLLWAAGGLALIAGIPALSAAIVGVIVLNAVFAFVQELQAERAVEALQGYLAPHATALRDGERTVVEAADVVPGDVLVIAEGDRVTADARLLEGALELDTSTLTGESAPAARQAGSVDEGLPLMQAPDIVFSGTSCTGGEATAVVFATGMQTELGRIAALSARTEREQSPLELQVRSVARLIALVAVVAGLAFIPIGMLGAGLPLDDATVFAIGLLVANVPEGLLPTITLSLAVGVRALARRRAVVKRLSAVETLGSTTVICSDKTGTLTENAMTAARVWTAAGELRLDESAPGSPSTANAAPPSGAEAAPETSAEAAPVSALARAMAACNGADLNATREGGATGDPTEVAMLAAAARLGADAGAEERERRRRGVFHFDPGLKLMSTVDERDGRLWIHTKGAPDVLLGRCTTLLHGDGSEQPLDAATRARLATTIDGYASEGLRVLGVARRALTEPEPPADRATAERDLCFLGLAALIDPPRPEIAPAVALCHAAGIRIVIVTGDHGLTAAAIARRVGIARGEPTIVEGSELDRMSEADLDRLLGEHRELIFSRATPEAKLRIADALRDGGEVVAMTGDGVNDAPALRRADIGVAMGIAGTDVAREAATMVLTDDNFATIVAAVEEGRRVYENIRKFIVYIFAHATPEVVPFLLFCLSGGAIPLPLTALQILAIDLGTETLPALALGREPIEPGLMRRPPRPRSEGVISRTMLTRAWLFLGAVSAALVMAGFLYVMLKAGWSPGDDTGEGSTLHDTYLQATTMTFLGIVACQVGTAFAARTEHASLRSIGVFSNSLLLWGIAFELAFAAAVIYLPPLQDAFGTAALGADALLFVLPFPLIVWGADELRRGRARRNAARA